MMINIFRFKENLYSVLLVLTIGCFFSCGPQIRSFTVTPLTIVKDDSVKIKWNATGNPTLLVNIDSAEEELPETRIFTLVVQKNGKEKRQIAEVTVLPVESADDIVFSTARNGATLVASFEKNINRWGTHFKLKTIAAAPGRVMDVTHAGKTVQLKADGSSSDLMEGLQNSGEWEVVCPLTQAEINDSTLIPSRLILHTVIVYKKI